MSQFEPQSLPDPMPSLPPIEVPPAEHWLRVRAGNCFVCGAILVIISLVFFLCAGGAVMMDQPYLPEFAAGLVFLLSGLATIICGHLCHIRASLEEANNR